jgi:hypothetical protein
MRFADDGSADEGESEEDFPAGDGTADSTAVVQCPHCWEAVEISLDPGSGSVQEYEQDCEICCRPWHVTVQYGEDGSADVSVTE